MSVYYLAVDIGASSGRHILGHVQDGKIHLEEIYRFENKLVHRNGHLCWELDKLFSEIMNGMKKCKERNKIPVTMGIDTWGVDFVLLGQDGSVIGDTVGYRDTRTDSMDEKVYEVITEKELYGRTGIQKQIFNTIYQLMAVKECHADYLEQAESFLMIPDYFHYLLTGKKINEYTNASTTGLVNVTTKDWDYELISKLGYPKEIFTQVQLPGSRVGSLKGKIVNEVGFDCEVVLPGTHDTASAVISVPVADSDDCIYISSGTWSLLGTEQSEADCSEEARLCNFTNEGGYEYRYRFLKNIMGLWMIQSVRKELKEDYSFAELCAMAEEVGDFPSKVDVDDICFLSPDSMTQAIQDYCRQHSMQVPETPGELAACIYQSLAMSYLDAVKEIETRTGKNYKCIHIVGGGCNAEYLNRLASSYTGKEVHAGPVEATAVGNLTVQMIEGGEFKSLEDARRSIYASFEVKVVKAE